MEQLGFLHHGESYGRSSRGWFPSCLIDSQNQRMVEEGTSGSACSNPCSSKDNKSRVPRTLLQQLWKISKKETSQSSLCRLCQCSIVHSTEGLPVFRQNLLCSSLFPLPLVLALGTTDKSLAPSSLY